MKKSNNTQTITLVEEKFIKKTKNKLYLVLRQKGLADIIIDGVNKELEKRLEIFWKSIVDKLETIHFDNPEESLKYLLLKQVTKILDDMEKEKMLNLSDEDKKVVFDILNDKEKEKENKEKENKEKKNREKTLKKDNDSDK